MTTAQHALLASPPRLPLVAPSLLAADWARLGDEARLAIDHGADLLHIDVMDGHFVPNLAFGPDAVAALRAALPSAYLDVHLMVEDPAHFLPIFVEAGADHVSFHVEVLTPDVARDLAAEARELGVEVGLVINPPTPLTDDWLATLDAFDLFLVMSVNPGYSGQKFIPAVLDKARAARARAGERLRIQFDGGVSPANAADVRDAGGDVLVAGSAYFAHPPADRARVLSALRGTSE